ncbi:MAG: DUF1223 domain-containing protein [Ferruginibacter sp.]
MKNKYLRFGLLMGSIVSVIAVVGFLVQPPKPATKAAGKGFALVELFTSEGCSSCPAADALVEKLSGQYPENLYVLAFHVDYWNRLGWKDEFSSAAYSARQQEYAASFKLEGAYTPQAVVNGKAQLVGSDATGLRRIIDNEINSTTNPATSLSATATTGQTVQVSYKVEAPANTLVNIALIQTAAETNVKRGENQGRILHHINIVRDFKSVDNAAHTGEVSMQLPEGLAAKECKVLLCLQYKDTRKIAGVATALIK